jgi:hypothetical protein
MSRPLFRGKETSRNGMQFFNFHAFNTQSKTMKLTPLSSLRCTIGTSQVRYATSTKDTDSVAEQGAEDPRRK